MRIYLSLMIWFASAVALLAQVDSTYKPNRFIHNFSETAQHDFYETVSPTIEPWALKFAFSAGGVIFGKGTTQVFYVDLFGSLELEASSLNISIGDGGELFIHAATFHNGATAINSYKVNAHFFAVCPMAKHVLRNAPLGFTIPPYINENIIDEARLEQYKDGYIAKEFASDIRVSELVRESDFWPELKPIRMPILANSLGNLKKVRRLRVFWPLDQQIGKEIMRDVNAIDIPFDSDLVSGRHAYFTGDFHLNTKINLNPLDGSATVFGFPLTYHQKGVEINGRMNVDEIEIMANIPGVPLTSAYDNFGSTDFKSLYDLSATFAFFRDNAPDKLRSFVARECLGDSMEIQYNETYAFKKPT